MAVTVQLILILLWAAGFSAVEDAEQSDVMLVKREAGKSCEEKFRRLGTHSACRTASADSKPLPVSQPERDQIVDIHNDHRRKVSPTASNMLQMSWDEEIAMIAQTWAETCSRRHDDNQDRNIPGRIPLGQNIGAGYSSWSAVIAAWFEEVKVFTYGEDNDFQKVGHYTQGVWADSGNIGCGASNCKGVNFHVCNYGPAGNVGSINKPYLSGDSCGTCPQHCNNKLCDCGDGVCENGGQMNRSSCSCQCRQAWQMKPLCSLNCSRVEEPKQCGNSPFSRQDCPVYSNVPQDCPNTCNVCASDQSAGATSRLSHLLLCLHLLAFCPLLQLIATP